MHNLALLAQDGPEREEATNQLLDSLAPSPNKSDLSRIVSVNPTPNKQGIINENSSQVSNASKQGEKVNE